MKGHGKLRAAQKSAGDMERRPEQQFRGKCDHIALGSTPQNQRREEIRPLVRVRLRDVAWDAWRNGGHSVWKRTRLSVKMMITLRGTTLGHSVPVSFQSSAK